MPRKIHAPTPEESARWRRAVEEEERAMPENIARGRRFRDALQEQTIAGQLRRAIVESRCNTRELARDADLPWETLDAFLEGEPIDSAAFSRLAAVLKFHLVSVTE